MKMRWLLIASLLVLEGCALRGTYYLEHRVAPVGETAPVISSGDAADDPAIWINPDNPEASLIVATDKQSGLHVYDLNGSERQYLRIGFTNNVDLRTAPWGKNDLTLVVASRRYPSQLVLLALDHESGELRLLKQHPVQLQEPYGICMYQDKNGQPYVFLNSTDGSFAQYSVNPEFEITEVRNFKLRTRVEGCVADDDDGLLYIGEEDRGIWRMSAGPEDPVDRRFVDTVIGGPLVSDVEGLAIYHGQRKLLVASSQGDNSYAVYDAETSEYLISFHVTGDSKIDGVSETDGIDVTAVSLPGFPHGMLVVQDGYNTDPTENQNFKIVSWSDVMEILERQ